jgi:hypothetical protein
VKHQKHQRFDTPLSAYSAFRELLTELLNGDDSFKASYLRAEFESKLLDPLVADSPENRRSKAIAKWLESEELNRQTSVRLLHHNEEDFIFLIDELYPAFITDILSVARRFISETLGEVIPWDSLSGSFSGGASTSIRRGTGTIARKYQEGTDITEEAIMPFLRLTRSDVWAPRDFRCVRGNVLFTVPKTSMIDRCACKEPDYNMFVQKAIGDYIRRALKRKGINLNDQTLNQRLSRHGSLYNDLATVDLSSASDSITTQLVMLLVPEEWFNLMDDVRSKTTMIDGVEHTNYMFSSMGNAFTFELESLIFWALTRACAFITQTRGRISVYGDDIICPVGLKDAVLSTFAYCGFRVNAKKSFFEGPFRESCGKHWYNGVDVTPFYVKKVPVDASDWCLLLNSLRKWADCAGGICDPRYFDIWALFSSLVPEPVKGPCDLAVRSNLCAPGRFPIARLVRKHERDERSERRYALGAYLHWLSAGEDRESPTELVTSIMSYDGALVIRRSADRMPRVYPKFPQELRGEDSPHGEWVASS